MTSSTPINPPHLLIIGAGPGLGAGIARRFGREGFAVTLVARREEPLLSLPSSCAATVSRSIRLLPTRQTRAVSVPPSRTWQGALRPE
jgi:short-subunit dehydrogenase